MDARIKPAAPDQFPRDEIFCTSLSLASLVEILLSGG
jgi:hypothetical protein